MGRPALTADQILAQGVALDVAFRKFAPPRRLPDDRTPLASLMPRPAPLTAEAPAEVLLGLQVIRDTIHKHDEMTQNRWSRFRTQLVSGRLWAAGFVAPRAAEAKPVLVPGEIWTHAAIDLSLSTVTSDQGIFEGLRVVRATAKKRRAD